MSPREEFVSQMERLRKAIKKTESEYLKRDYKKALRNMELELRDYNRFRSESRA